MKRLLAVAALSLLLTGCAATAAPSGEPTTAPATSAPTSDTAPTLRQWASVVAEQKTSLDGWQSRWDVAQCSGSDGSNSPCGAQLLEASFIAETISMSLDSAANKGTPPREIRELATATTASSVDADKAGKAWVASCNSAAAAECAGLSGRVEITMRMLETKFAAWAPYL
jgi:hypothetical protein